uniref:ABC transporter ATP-binding protein n=1 Tax=Candidatus Fimivicinus sp. TaxID=3056640 RepID=UPI003FEFD2BC
MNESIRVSNLCKNYGTFQLKDVSFTLPQGCIMGLIGENGAGKSTTLKLLLNLIHKDSGEISIFGLDPVKEEQKIKEQIGVVFDENFFHDVLRAKDIPSVMRPVYANWDDRLFDSLCARFQLPWEKKIKEYSRGMKMKLSIAVAMAHHPRLLLLDEATSGLDPVVRNEILDLFQEFIQDERNSILLSSHITSDLERVADYITFIHQGRILASESKDDLLLSHRILRCG